jgi:hypothetical protein
MARTIVLKDDRFTFQEDARNKKKAGVNTGPALEAYDDIVIWEGNYTADT